MKLRQVPSTFDEWFCIWTKVRMEDSCVHALANVGITAFNPKIEVYESGSSENGTRIVTMFRRYIFVQLRCAADYYKARWAPNVVEIVSAGGKPIGVSPDVIRGIKAAIGPQGFVKVNRPIAGDTVVIATGALKGITGQLLQEQSEKRRTTLLLDFMHRSVSAQLEGARIQKALSNQAGVS